MKRIELQSRTGRAAMTGMTAALATVAVAGCGGSSPAHSKTGADTTGSHTTNPDLVLARAADASSAAVGAKVGILLHETVGGRSVDMTGSGSVSSAKRTADMTMHIGGSALNGMGTMTMRVVLAKGTVYMKMPANIAGRLPGGKQWLSIDTAQIAKVAHIPGYGSMLNSSSSMTNPGQYLAFLNGVSKGSVKNLGQATVNGVATTHYHANVDLGKLMSAVPAKERTAVDAMVTTLMQRGHITQLPIDVWIDQSHLVRRVQINYSMTLNGDKVATQVTENLSDYGPQPAPTVPSPSETTDILSLLSNQ